MEYRFEARNAVQNSRGKRFNIFQTSGKCCGVWKITGDTTTRAKTARNNQHLHEISNDYSRRHRKYVNGAATEIQRRGDIDKARNLNSNRKQQLLTKNSGQA